MTLRITLELQLTVEHPPALSLLSKYDLLLHINFNTSIKQKKRPTSICLEEGRFRHTQKHCGITSSAGQPSVSNGSGPLRPRIAPGLLWSKRVTKFYFNLTSSHGSLEYIQACHTYNHWLLSDIWSDYAMRTRTPQGYRAGAREKQTAVLIFNGKAIRLMQKIYRHF